MFAAEQTQVQSTTLYPSFQIWRCDENGALISVFSTNNLVPSSFNDSFNLYEYRVQFGYTAGDFVGLYQPSEGSKLMVAYQTLDTVIARVVHPNFRVPSQEPLETYTYLESTSQEDLNYTPLLTVTTAEEKMDSSNVLQTCIGQTLPTTPDSSVSASSPGNELTNRPTNITEPLATTSIIVDGGSSVSILTIAGSAVGAVIGLLLLLVATVLVFLLALKCKRRTKEKFVMKPAADYTAPEGKLTCMNLWSIMCVCCHNRIPHFGPALVRLCCM